MTTYRGKTIPRFLIHGQRVIRVPLGVRYDPADPTHEGLGESLLTTIVGVPESDLVDDEQRQREAAQDRDDLLAKGLLL